MLHIPTVLLNIGEQYKERDFPIRLFEDKEVVTGVGMWMGMGMDMRYKLLPNLFGVAPKVTQKP